MMRLVRAVIFLLIGIAIAQSWFYYPNLPARIASHYDGAGAPDGWASKENFLIFEIVILFVILCEFAVLPFLLEKIPDNLINLPHKEYWLAPERRHETFRVLGHFFEWLAVGLLGLFIAINQMIFKANIENTNLPSAPMWMILGAFIVYVLAWMIKLTRQFKIKK